MIKIILIAICSKFFKDSRLHFFWFSPKIWLTGKKNKSYIVFSFYLNLMDYPKQTVTTPSTQLEKSTKNDQQTKGKKKRKKKNKAQSKAQSEEQNRAEMVTDNRLVEDPSGKILFHELWMGNAQNKVQFYSNDCP